MSWSGKRKLQYLGGVFGVFFIILFIFLYPIIFKKPTCTDGKMNGDEKGIDCGGVCSRMCKNTTVDPIIHWSRAFFVGENIYNFVAYIENQNQNSGIANINYEFRAYDSNNKLLGRRNGTTYIPPNKKFAIFESHFDAGESKVKSITFEFIPPYNWVKKDSTLNNLALYVDNVLIGKDVKNPSLSASVKNDSIYDAPYFEAIAILYDEQGNAINASKTYKDGLASGGSLPIFFTWPEEFRSVPVIKDILIQINPFNTSL